MEPLIGLVGVILGFSLGEISRIIRESRRKRKLKSVLFSELQSLISLIKQKSDHIQLIIDSLSKKVITPGQTVGILEIGYKNNITDLYNHLTVKERNCLHIIYERLRITNNEINQFESSIKSDIKEKAFEDPYRIYRVRFEKLKESNELVLKLIDSMLSKNPIDVMEIDFK
ncbi:hypothetical protein [Cohnella sp. AR92]|uniref:hypothetical protein n=1 Tax=Cohnella sp. AR92 TaxID=648716 RepID=UPI000F8E76C9|nr:hypothetical protein [Cohnella sp. AR92]RUS44986.1 hypothetical protein ELR57_22285 [Cohnella sp. AR92]